MSDDGAGLDGGLSGFPSSAGPPAPPGASRGPTSSSVRTVVLCITVAGLLTLGITAHFQVQEVNWTAPNLVPAYLFAALLIAGELRPLLVTRHDGEFDTVTVSTTFAVALALAGPLLLAMLAQGIAVGYDDIVRRRSYLRGIYNIAQYTVTLAVTRAVFCITTGHDLLQTTTSLTPGDILPGLLAGTAFVASNNGLVALIVAVETRANPIEIIIGDVKVQGLATSILIGLAPLTAIAADFSPLTVPLVVLPLIGVLQSAHVAARRQYEALHDGLTSLPNRSLLHRRMRTALEKAVDLGTPTGVMLLDLDHFKEVNDTLGHHVGDALLIEVARRLRALCPPEVTVCRLGGDEFAVLAPGMHIDDVKALADRLCEALHRPAVVEGVRIALQSSIGVALAPDHASTVEALLQRADIALYRAKDTRGTAEVYREEIDTHTVQRLNLLADLHIAVAEDQFYVAYQPIVDAGSSRVVGLEALLRWTHPAHGDIPPTDFIDLAERSGSIAAMSHRAMNLALCTSQRLRERGHDLSMSVNLSPRLLSDLELPAAVATYLLDHHVPARRLTIEVTESTIAADPKRAMEVLQHLRDMGVRLSVDDFGTGYSSLSYLSRLRPDELKVDRSFVSQMVKDSQAATIVRSTIELGHALGMSITAEGVEDRATYDALVRLGCDRIQGFLIGRPIAEGLLNSWLDQAPIPQPRTAIR